MTHYLQFVTSFVWAVCSVRAVMTSFEKYKDVPTTNGERIINSLINTMFLLMGASFGYLAYLSFPKP